MTKVFVHIEHLCLRGIRPDARDGVVAALREQLTLDYASPGVVEKWAASGHRERLRARIERADEPMLLGREVAAAISGAGRE